MKKFIILTLTIFLFTSCNEMLGHKDFSYGIIILGDTGTQCDLSYTELQKREFSKEITEANITLPYIKYVNFHIPTIDGYQEESPTITCTSKSANPIRIFILNQAANPKGYYTKKYLKDFENEALSESPAMKKFVDKSDTIIDKCIKESEENKKFYKELNQTETKTFNFLQLID